jgi:hypothetical protein
MPDSVRDAVGTTHAHFRAMGFTGAEEPTEPVSTAVQGRSAVAAR